MTHHHDTCHADFAREGFATVTPHLVVYDAAAAIEFYQRAFGAVETMPRVMFKDGKRVMHAEFRIGNSILMMADEFREFCNATMGAPTSLGGTTISLHIYVPDTDAAYERALMAGASSQMPPADMFWGDRYCQVLDPFGHLWSLATKVGEMKAPEYCAPAKHLATANA